MKHLVSTILLTFSGIFSAITCGAQPEPPKPYGATPTKHQVEWQKLEYYLFVHFGPNTFTNVEWGNGKEDPQVFNPSRVDCRQWAATAKAAGMKGIILTAKHHDGFCLWPSKYSAHTVRESRWKEGNGDLLKDLSEACREYELKFGVYLSPWDQNHPEYGSPEYNHVFSNTLNEVLSNYGEIFEQWFDGANGEGHEGKKQDYDWKAFHETVYRNQPQAVIFSDVGPGCRWVGNEKGFAGETNWSTINVEGFAPGKDAPPTETLNSGEQGGKAWVPAEADVSIRPGWFYSPDTDEEVKPVSQLMDLYYSSVGRNANLLLNVPPDRRGRIHPNDSTRLIEFRKAREEAFRENLIAGATITANNTRGNSTNYSPCNLLDENYDTYWTTDDEVLNPSLEIQLKGKRTLNRLLLQEYIPLGQRVTAFEVHYWDTSTGNWKELIRATTVGYKRILRFPAITTERLRIDFQALACPVLSAIGLYESPEQTPAPVVERNKAGSITIRSTSPDPVIYYTLDGSLPSEASPEYKQPFPLPDGGMVKAIAVAAKTGKSEITTASFDIAPSEWKIVSPSTPDIENTIDENRQTFAGIPITDALVIDLGKEHALKGFTYIPQAKEQAPNITQYHFYTSLDGEQWEEVKHNASFDNIANNPVAQKTLFDRTIPARYIKLQPVETVGNKQQYTISELQSITNEEL